MADKFINELMSEFILYGGMVATRAEVYEHAKEVTFNNARLVGLSKRESKAYSEKYADIYAFGHQAKPISEEEKSALINAGMRFNPATGEPVGRKCYE